MEHYGLRNNHTIVEHGFFFPHPKPNMFAQMCCDCCLLGRLLQDQGLKCTSSLLVGHQCMMVSQACCSDKAPEDQNGTTSGNHSSNGMCIDDWKDRRVVFESHMLPGEKRRWLSQWCFHPQRNEFSPNFSSCFPHTDAGDNSGLDSPALSDWCRGTSRPLHTVAVTEIRHILNNCYFHLYL